jgi:hypothetical protein
MDEVSTKKSKKESLLNSEQDSAATVESSSGYVSSGQTVSSSGQSSKSSKWKLQPPGVYYQRMKSFLASMTG